MADVCLHHCSQLMLRSTSERQGLCLADPLGCQNYREKSAQDDDREAIKEIFEEIFDIDNIAAKIDLVTLVEMIHTADEVEIEKFSNTILPPIDWIKLDDIGVGHDWSGAKLAVVCEITHPYLRAVVGLIIGINDARLTLGDIEQADVSAFVEEQADLCNYG